MRECQVSKGCFQGFREDDEFGGALHGVVDWREEPFSSWDSKGGVLYFSCNFLKIIEGNCPFFEDGTDLFDNFLTSFGCWLDGAVDAIDEPSKKFLGGGPCCFPLIHFLLGCGVLSLVLSDFWRGEDGVCSRDESSGEFL